METHFAVPISGIMRPSRRAVIVGLGATAVVGRHAWAEGLPEVAVMKDPTCGCCEKWVTHLRE